MGGGVGGGAGLKVAGCLITVEFGLVPRGHVIACHPRAFINSLCMSVVRPCMGVCVSAGIPTSKSSCILLIVATDRRVHSSNSLVEFYLSSYSTILLPIRD